jgi:peptide/nickel transport system permease protein
MLMYIAKRLVLLVPILLGISLLTFSLMHLIPGDPAEILLRQQGIIPTQEAIEKFREQMDLNDPLPIQYFNWMYCLLHGDLGSSLSVSYGKPVLSEIMFWFPRTLELAAVSLLISLLISIPLGILSAVKQNSAIDHLTLVGASLGIAMPVFWLGLLLMWLFSVYLGWFPVCGYGSVKHVVLPSITLGIGMVALTTRLMRASMLEVLEEDYIITARGKGLRERVVIMKHALKNALIPVVTVAGLQFGWLLEGAIFVEVIFTWPGIGKLLVDSISARDIPMVQGCVLFVACVFVLVNLAVDISYGMLDPRVRYERS